MAGKQYFADGRVAEARLGAALIGHFDLQGMGAGIEAGEGNRGFHLPLIDLLGSEIGIGLEHALGQHGRCHREIGAFGLDLDFAAIEVVAIGNDPADPDDIAVDRGANAERDIGRQKVGRVGFDPAHPPGLGGRYTGKTDQQ